MCTNNSEDNEKKKDAFDMISETLGKAHDALCSYGCSDVKLLKDLKVWKELLKKCERPNTKYVENYKKELSDDYKKYLRLEWI